MTSRCFIAFIALLALGPEKGISFAIIAQSHHIFLLVSRSSRLARS